MIGARQIFTCFSCDLIQKCSLDFNQIANANLFLRLSLPLMLGTIKSQRFIIFILWKEDIKSSEIFKHSSVCLRRLVLYQ